MEASRLDRDPIDDAAWRARHGESMLTDELTGE
jgi:hypothetical protein